MRIIASLLVSACVMLATSQPSMAKDDGLSKRDSFRVGDAGVLCTAQYTPADKRLQSIFDRGYQLVCRDASSAVGSLLALRGSDRGIPSAGTAAFRCDAEATIEIDGVGPVVARTCRDDVGGLDYRRYVFRHGATTYLAEGLAGYDLVLRFGLAALVADKPVPGNVQVATTLVSDPAAFASVQAGQLDARGARREAYGRNNGGSFAQAAAFFESLSARSESDSSDTAEFIANQGLQLSNLGDFKAAEAMFARAERKTPMRDGVTQLMIRNFRAIDALNRKQSEMALDLLDRPVSAIRLDRDDALIDGQISNSLSQAINRENESLKRLGGAESGLTNLDRAAILDGQRLQLRGIALQQLERNEEARVALEDALRAITAVRNGRVISISWLKSQIAADLAALAESAGDLAGADSYLLQAIDIYRVDFPYSPALLAAMARRASFLSRTGREAEASTLFDSVIGQADMVNDSAAALRDLIQPYFDLLARRSDANAAAALFKVSQVLQRPGVAQTQAILARELSEGNGEAAALFRLSVARTRDIVRTQGEIEAFASRSDLSSAEVVRLDQSRELLTMLSRSQTEIQSKLAVFPNYRAAVPANLSLGELQSNLLPGELYYKLTIVGNQAFAQAVTATGARSFLIDRSLAGLSDDVAFIRDSISRLENGVRLTDPFDLKRARALYLSLFGPIEGELAAANHLIFEPDGPMLQLPPYLLITNDESIAAYEARLAGRNPDEFDYRGVAWLGRDHSVSIAVSPRSFVEVRKIAPSRGRRPYLGLGHHRPEVVRPVLAAADECDWPITTWKRPISDAELRLANSLFGGGAQALVTDAAFSDTALAGRTDLSDYRILHFATHGLVTAPRPECPARPALVTSFGGGDSDGLLSFREVFDLKLDADVVLLSACDTAGIATSAATREAGITTGGNYALDGLVRAFIGAGARSVMASHWPVPDDFDATGRLIGGLFKAAPGVGLADALRDTQRSLMDDANTSHPYYWAAFVVLGDGKKTMVPMR